ncbi:glycosyltransferase family 39 protein [Comamonadaceae bacterium OTU4NAUVB1]|nr:glycosyltransferase family 39 protein [Comamonadaceae bacterium OTU4NAUVB1]
MRPDRTRPPHALSPAAAFGCFALLHVALWTLLPSLLAANLPLDTIEALSWGREWQAGYYKHPPASGWLAELFRWGSLDWPLFLLSQLAIAAAFWAAWEIARDVLPPWTALVAVMALEGVNYYNLTGLEFNANVVQYPCWAIASLAFWRAARRAPGTAGGAGLGWWVLLGVACGFGALGKYSFLTLPVSMAVALIAVPSLRGHWRGAGPWLTLVISLAMFAPHLAWAHANDYPTLRYATGRAMAAGGGSGGAVVARLKDIAAFLGAQAGSVAPLALLLWIANGWRRRGGGAVAGSAVAGGVAGNRAADGGVALRGRDGWLLLAMGGGPLAIYLIAGAAGVHLHDMWGSPLFLVIGPALAAALGLRLRHPKRFAWAFAVWTLVLVLLYGLIAIGGPLARGRLSRIHYPGRELAVDVAQGWHRAVGSQAPLRIVAGHAWPAGNVAQYLPPQAGGRPSVYIDADPGRAAWLDDAAVRTRGAVFVWEAVSGQVLETPPVLPPADWSARFPGLRVQPPLHLTARRFGRPFEVTVGWAILPPAGDTMPAETTGPAR